MAKTPVQLNSKEAARRIGVAPCRIRYYVMQGRLRAVKEGRDLWFDPADVAAFRRRPPGRPRNDEPLTEAA